MMIQNSHSSPDSYENLETLEGFWNRTRYIMEPLPAGGYSTSNGLRQKADEQGNLLPFQGSTVVFPLPEDIRGKIAYLQGLLYQRCPWILAAQLHPDTFHITLHDLLAGSPSRELEEAIKSLQPKAVSLVRQIAAEGGTVQLRSTRMINMVGTSLVLCFAPADEESCRRLMRYYQVLQQAVPLNYPLTPHVTLAYYRPGWISPDTVRILQETVEEAASWEPLAISLPVSSVEYQHFSDMNQYWNADPACGRP